jgi:hypothetical protein
MKSFQPAPLRNLDKYCNITFYSGDFVRSELPILKVLLFHLTAMIVCCDSRTRLMDRFPNHPLHFKRSPYRATVLDGHERSPHLDFEIMCIPDEKREMWVLATKSSDWTLQRAEVRKYGLSTA